MSIINAIGERVRNIMNGHDVFTNMDQSNTEMDKQVHLVRGPGHFFFVLFTTCRHELGAAVRVYS